MTTPTTVVGAMAEAVGLLLDAQKIVEAALPLVEEHRYQTALLNIFIQAIEHLRDQGRYTYANNHFPITRE